MQELRFWIALLTTMGRGRAAQQMVRLARVAVQSRSMTKVWARLRRRPGLHSSGNVRCCNAAYLQHAHNSM